jgi:hypothetical protein
MKDDIGRYHCACGEKTCKEHLQVEDGAILSVGEGGASMVYLDKKMVQQLISDLKQIKFEKEDTKETDKDHELIAKCLEAGWRLQIWADGVLALTPPNGDPRATWCAEWKDCEVHIAIPDWASPEVPKVGGG